MSKSSGSWFSTLNRTFRWFGSEKTRRIDREHTGSPRPTKQMQVTELSQKIQTYLTHLFKYITPKYCFVSGAFVIQDNHLKLYNILKSYYKLAKRYPAFASHLKYSNKTKVVNSANPYLKEVIFEKGRVSVTCDSAVKSEGITRHFRMVKWYKFNQTKGGKRNTYIYLKPETSSGSNNREHVGNFMSKKENTKKIPLAAERSPRSKSPSRRHGNNPDYLLYRREDCDNPKYASCQYSSAKKQPYEFYANTHISGKTVSNVETYKRQGDEVFIPNEVSDFLVDMVEQEKEIEVTSDSKTVIIEEASIAKH